MNFLMMDSLIQDLKSQMNFVLHVSVNIVFMLAYKIYNKFQSD